MVGDYVKSSFIYIAQNHNKSLPHETFLSRAGPDHTL